MDVVYIRSQTSALLRHSSVRSVLRLKPPRCCRRCGQRLDACVVPPREKTPCFPWHSRVKHSAFLHNPASNSVVSRPVSCPNMAACYWRYPNRGATLSTFTSNSRQNLDGTDRSLAGKQEQNQTRFKTPECRCPAIAGRDSTLIANNPQSPRADRGKALATSGQLRTKLFEQCLQSLRRKSVCIARFPTWAGCADGPRSQTCSPAAAAR